jgi:hypothetical protein
MLGFAIVHGGDDAAFTSFRAGTGFLNLVARPAERKRVIAAGYRPDTAPRDAEWGERFFHLTDPDGHELSFAWPLRQEVNPPRTLAKPPGTMTGGRWHTTLPAQADGPCDKPAPICLCGGLS